MVLLNISFLSFFFGHTFTNFVKEFLSNTQVPEMVLNSVGIVLEKCISVSEAIKVGKSQKLFLLTSILPNNERKNLPNFAITSKMGQTKFKKTHYYNN